MLGLALDSAVSDYPLEVAHRLLFQRWKKRAYVSYPISDAQSKPRVWRQVGNFRRLVRQHLTAFDPLMIDEKRLQGLLAEQRPTGAARQHLVCEVRGRRVKLSRAEVEGALADIDGQIVARDYKLIDQAEMVVAYFPRDLDGGPLIAAGVQSEIEHAAASTKQVVIVWESQRDPTPFIGKKVDVRLSTLAELERFLGELNQRSQPPSQIEMSFSEDKR